jgi:nicotinate dehydrogenase subunit B
MNTVPSRRDLLAGAGILVAFSFTRGLAQAAEAAAPEIGTLRTVPMLDAWIRLTPDGRVAIFSGKAELGQGISTAMVQIAAEELALPGERISIVSADTARTPDEGLTAGSNSMHDSGAAILNAAANVRVLLIEAAAKKWGVEPAGLELTGGAVVAPDGRRLTVGELASGLSLHVAARAEVRPRVQPAQRPDLKRPDLKRPDLKRIDIPAKLNGGQAYVQDLRLPGMLHARVVRAASHGSRIDADIPTAANLPGVVKVVREGRFTAVVAETQWQAIKAMRKLQAAPATVATPFPQSDQIHAALQASVLHDEVVLDRKTATPVAAAAEVSARYSRPYLMHGSIGPSCAVAQFENGTMTVWTHSQGVFVLRGCLAELLHLPLGKVRCIHTPSAGCYGQNGADDVAADAAMAAMAVPGKPVRLQWMREQEHGWEPLGSAQVSQARATLGADGRIASWDYEVWSHPHDNRPKTAGRLLAGMEVDPPFPYPAPTPIAMPAGDGHRNSIPIYDIPQAKVLFHYAPQSALRVSALRSLGAHHNVFSIESFMDELAAAAKADPVAFRLKHLTDPRGRAVVNEAAARFGWNGYKHAPGSGRGFAYARYKNSATYCAIAMDLTLDRATGQVRLGRIVAAVDSGRAVSTDGIRNQIEGAILQSLSWTLQEQTRFTPNGRTSVNWATYPIIRFQAQPTSVEVHVIDHPDQGFLGAGEAGQGPAAAALANALTDAAGVRLRDMPFTPDKVKAAIVRI